MKENALAEDLAHILAATVDVWEELRGCRLFVTGGTGFFGCWFLESFAWANEKLELDASVVVLTRNISQFEKKAPHLVINPSIQFHVGDIRTFNFPEGNFSHIIHAAATSAVATFHGEDPLEKFDTVVSGTRRVLDFAVQCNARTILYTSSGAVYGKQPYGMTHITEDYCGAPVPFEVSSVWGESKRAAELLCACYAQKYDLEVKVARCFSFVGPYLQSDIHYAIGNFISDGLEGRVIKVNGDGTPHRSYLYAADLVIWLWTILVRGDSCVPYNVGSEDSISIAELAQTVARNFNFPVEVAIAKSPLPNCLTDRYVPSTKRAQQSLGLKEYVDLNQAILRTIKWNRLSV